MKYPLILVVLLMGSVCHGQKYYKLDSIIATGTSGTGMILSSGALAYTGKTEIKFDTVRTAFLLCDTFMNTNYEPALFRRNYFEKTGKTTWVLGWAIRKITIEGEGRHFKNGYYWYNSKDEYSYSTEKYLDDDMKPLTRYIIWQAITLK